MDSAGERILIVDDEPPLLKMMNAYLQRLGYSVTTAVNNEQAASLDPSAFAVAVLDASIRGLSMKDLALQMLHSNSKLRVLAASGYPVDVSALEAAAPGRVGFLHKPFSPQMLAAAVRGMLGSEEKSISARE